MTKFEKLAETKFSGNKYATMEYILTFCSPEANETLYNSFSQKEKNIYLDVLKDDLKKAGGLDFIQTEADLSAELNIEPEELINIEKNPFKPKIIKDVLIIFFSFAICVLSQIALSSTEVFSVLSGGLGSYFSFHLAKQIINSIKFNRVKRTYNSEEYKAFWKDFRNNPPKKGVVSVSELYSGIESDAE